MEAKQTAQMVTWLDEERRKDKALITKLEERVASQAALLEDQSRRIHALETGLASLQSKTLSISSFDETVARLRTEIAALVESAVARREQSDLDFKKLREVDREGVMKALDELRQEMIARLERELQLRRAEEERLSRVANELQLYATNLTKGLEEFQRTLAFLEEQRRQDSRRISDMSGEIIELTKRMESHKAKLELLEDLSRRNERTVGQISGELGDFKQQRQAWAEQEALAAQQREQAMAEVIRRMDSFAEDMDQYAQQFETWGATYRVMKKQVDDFDRLADRMDRRLNEVAEVQRLSEERFRKDWEEFLQDDQKRWRQFTLTAEEARREHQRSMDDLQSTMRQLMQQVQALTDHLKNLRASQQDALRGLTAMIQSLREQSEDSSLPPLS